MPIGPAQGRREVHSAGRVGGVSASELSDGARVVVDEAEPTRTRHYTDLVADLVQRVAQLYEFADAEPTLADGLTAMKEFVSVAHEGAEGVDRGLDAEPQAPVELELLATVFGDQEASTPATADHAMVARASGEHVRAHLADGLPTEVLVRARVAGATPVELLG